MSSHFVNMGGTVTGALLTDVGAQAGRSMISMAPAIGVPTSLSISIVSDTQADLTWTLAGGGTGVEIQYRGTDNVWTALTTKAAGSTSHSDTGLGAATGRGYRVRETYPGGVSDWSNVAIDATTKSGNILPVSDWRTRTIYAWMNERVLADFSITLQTATDTTGSMAVAETFEVWSTHEQASGNNLKPKIIRVQPEEFLLSNIESNSTGAVELDSGASGSVDGITVNSVEVMNGAESFDTDLNTTATNVAASINTKTSSPNYSARAAGPRVIIKADATGTGPDGFAVVSSVTTIATTDTNMADGNTIRMVGHRNGYVQPEHAAFLSYWKTPSGWNKYYDTDNCYHRAYQAIFSDILFYFDEFPSADQRTDFSGQKFGIWALTHWLHENHPIAVDVIGDNVRSAFEDLIEELWTGHEAMDVGGNSGADMEAFALRGGAYLVGLGIITPARYETHAQKVLEKIFNPRGGIVNNYHCDHGSWGDNAPDNSYEGIWVRFLGVAAVAEDALVPGVTLVRDALRRSLECQAHMAMSEYNYYVSPESTGDSYGRVIGPSSMNTAAEGNLASQFKNFSRQLVCGLYYRDWRFWLLGTWSTGGTDSFTNKRVKSDADMKGDGRDIQDAITGLNGTDSKSSWKEPVYSQSMKMPTNSETWSDALCPIAIHPTVFTGYHTELLAQYDAGNDAERFPPMRRALGYIKEHGDFKSALIGELGMLLHLGPVVTTWSSDINAFGGGSLCGVWRAGYGTFIMGFTNGTQGAAPETWADHETWACHAIQGEDDTGTPLNFSSARCVGQGLVVASVSGNDILCTDTDDMSGSFLDGEKFRLVEGNVGEGSISTFTCNGNSSWAANVLTITCDESAASISNARAKVYSNDFSQVGYTSFAAEHRGKIGPSQGGYSSESTAITGDVDFKHTYTGTKNNLRIVASIVSDNADAITLLYEQIPIFLKFTADDSWLGGTNLVDTTIEYWSGSAWTTLTTTPVSTDEIRLGRDSDQDSGGSGTMDGLGQGYVYIHFLLQSEDVSLSSAVQDINGASDRCRNIHVDMLDGGSLMPASRSLTYDIRTTSGLGN